MDLMQTPNINRHPIIHWGLIALTALMIQGCGQWEQGVPEMSERERQTVEAYTKTQEPVCIGRFQVAMPKQLQSKFSTLTVNSAQISAKLTTQQTFNQFIVERTMELEKHRVDDRDAPFLKNVFRNEDHNIVIFDHNRGAGSYDFSRTLEGYRREGLTMFKVKIDAIDLSDKKT